MGLQEESKADKTFLEDDSDREAEKHGEKCQPLMNHKTERKPQESLMRSGDIECSHKPAPQHSPDDFSACSSFDVRTSERVMRFIKRLHQRTGIAMDPREVVKLVANAGGDDQLALRRYFAAGLPKIPQEVSPSPHELPRWSPPGAMQGTHKQRGIDKELKNSCEESEKKRCGLTKVLRRRKGVS